MDFRQLEIFKAVVDCGSMSEASKILFISQPSISARLRSLEEELGVDLLDRSKRPLELSAAGQRVYRMATDALSLQASLERDLIQTQRFEIRIGASSVPATHLLPRFLTHFRKIHPKTSFLIQQSDSYQVCEEVANGLLDLGLVGSKSSHDGLEYKVICQDELVLALPKTERYAQMLASQTPFSAFLDEPFLLREAGSGTLRESLKYLERLGLPADKLKIVARMNDPETLRQCVINGGGLALISRYTVEDLAKRGEILIMTLPGPATRPLYLVKRKGSLSAILLDFVKEIGQLYGSEG